MPFVFLILGLLFIIVAIRGTQGAAFDLLKSEFTGAGNFIIFVSAIAILGAVGYVPPLKKPADAMILLILLAMVLANKGGVFRQFNNAIRNPVTPQAASTTPIPFTQTQTGLYDQQAAALPGAIQAPAPSTDPIPPTQTPSLWQRLFGVTPAQ